MKKVKLPTVTEEQHEFLIKALDRQIALTNYHSPDFEMLIAIKSRIEFMSNLPDCSFDTDEINRKLSEASHE